MLRHEKIVSSSFTPEETAPVFTGQENGTGLDVVAQENISPAGNRTFFVKSMADLGSVITQYLLFE
jgi:hypothetical protein